MQHDDAEQLRPALREAEQTLARTLAEACALDPNRADTGELIRLEEMLSIASDAAKKAVSVRRRLGERRRRKSAAPAEDTPAAASAAAPTDDPAAPRVHGHDAVAHPALVQRSFTDARGVSWSVWSVYPSPDGSKTAALRGTFSQGWLAFECERERRRLSPIPDDWERLDEAGLLRLCDVAAPAQRPRRPRGGAADAAPDA